VFPQTFISFLLGNQILLSAGQLVPASAQEANTQIHASFLRQFAAFNQSCLYISNSVSQQKIYSQYGTIDFY